MFKAITELRQHASRVGQVIISVLQNIEIWLCWLIFSWFQGHHKETKG